MRAILKIINKIIENDAITSAKDDSLPLKYFHYVLENGKAYIEDRIVHTEGRVLQTKKEYHEIVKTILVNKKGIFYINGEEERGEITLSFFSKWLTPTGAIYRKLLKYSKE